MPKAIVCVTNDLYTDQRVNKVCTFLHEQGYDVLLVGRKRKNSLPLADRVYATHRIRLLFETGAKFYALFNLRLFFFLLFKRTDLIVSNDLDTLLACYLAKKIKHSPRLVYDSHEYFTEVPELIGRPRIQKIWLRIEEWIFPKLDTIYTVNESIATIYAEKYKKKIRVVRNISEQWTPSDLRSKEELGIPNNVHLLIVQGAGINVDRGIEEAVDAMQYIDAVMMIVGDGDVIPQLKERVTELGLETKVLFYGKKPYDVMMNYTYYADLGLTLDKPTSLNYKFSLPNKVFDYMHTSTPIIATNIVEVANVVKSNDIGVVIETLSAVGLADVINETLKNQDRMLVMKSNCEKAAEKENWKHECLTLAEIYPRVGN